MTPAEQVIRREQVGAVAIVRIERPHTKNSLTVEQIAELLRVLENIERSDARCMLLTGIAGCFCAGRDLRSVDPEQEDTYRIITTTINPLLRRLRALRIPTVAAVGGPALGLGLGLALSCDIVLAAEGARFGSPFRNFGGVTDSGGHYFLSRALGRHRALELIFTGHLIAGREAAALGLINRVLPDAELEQQSVELCNTIAAGPTAAFTMSKDILARERDFEEVIELEARYMDAALRGRDGREGLSAFKQRRLPEFVGK
jgi:2-(1,2-epoxy-1,2-dihydrophenyl)acetyl-CoA isomerase